MTSFLKTTNMWLMCAGLLSLAITALHVIGGTPEIMHPLYASNTPELSKGIAEVMWNEISLLCIVAGCILSWAAVKPKVAFDLSFAIIAIYLGITVLFIAAGISRFADIWVMPQWTLFLTVSILAIIGLYRNKKAASI